MLKSATVNEQDITMMKDEDGNMRNGLQKYSYNCNDKKKKKNEMV